MNKGSWSHFKHLIIRRLLGKNLSTPSKTGGRVPNQQGAPITCNLAYWEVSQQKYVQTLLASWGVVKEAKFRPSEALSFSQQHFLSKDIFFSRIAQLAKIGLKNRYFEEQIHWVALNIKSCELDLKALTERFLQAVLSLLLRCLLK